MRTRNVKIIFLDSESDFSCWAVEKSGKALLGLCATLNEQPLILESDGFHGAINNSIKVFALLNGYHLASFPFREVADLLTSYNVDGYFFLQDLIYETKSSKIMKDALDFEWNEEILELIEQNDKLNRTKISELLAQSNFSNKWTSCISKDIELVNNGNETWEWFFAEHCNDRHLSIVKFKDETIRKLFNYFLPDKCTCECK